MNRLQIPTVVIGCLIALFPVTDAGQDDSTCDALSIVTTLVQSKEIYLEPLEKSFGFKQAWIYAVRPVCRVTNTEIEEMIRRHAYLYYGGTSSDEVGDAIKEIMSVFLGSGDLLGNNDGTVTTAEKNALFDLVAENKGIRLLTCLYLVYRSMPE